MRYARFLVLSILAVTASSALLAGKCAKQDDNKQKAPQQQPAQPQG